MTELEKRKKLLAAESDVYRELLKMEFHTMKIYGAQARRRMNSVRTFAPWLMIGLELSGLMLRPKKKRRGWKGMSAMLLVGWQIYRKLAPWLRGRSQSRGAATLEATAEEYLASRI